MRPLDEVIADVERSNRGNRFIAELTPEESQRQRLATYSWVATYQLVAAVVLVPVCIQHWYTADGWSGPAAGLVAIGVAYSIVTELTRRIAQYTEGQRKELENLTRRLAAFVCAVHDGTVERAKMARLSAVLEVEPWERATDKPLRDDWVLISRAWEFWQDGLDEQGSTRCANCGRERRKHSADGRCPQPGLSKSDHGAAASARPAALTGQSE